MKVKDFTNYLEQLAPLTYQEEYDNSGLIIGDFNMEVKGVLITLDCNDKVLDEAINNKCNLLITHHPIIFKGLKKINNDSLTDKLVIKAIKNNIAIYSIHTNLDNIVNGVNSEIAKRLKLKNCRVLSSKNECLRQIVFYCPKENTADLIEKLCSVGAGAIGNYNNCSFKSSGVGTFKPLENSNPCKGVKGKLYSSEEDRVELVFLKDKQNKIIQTLQENHPYEEIAYQIYILDNKIQSIGSGLVGELDEPVDSILFLKQLKKIMNLELVRHTNISMKKIKKIALCGGSGSFLIDEAIYSNADIFITSDVKYHQFFDIDNKIILADIGHYESEQFTKHLVYDYLTKKFTKFAILLSKVNTNPINYL
tara:strand:- start:16 stop:1110 length:1095 start_codon:yes stop_codon:yes gene_type:complete